MIIRQPCAWCIYAYYTCACISNFGSRSFPSSSFEKMTVPGELLGASCPSEFASPAPPPMKLPLIYTLSEDEMDTLKSFISQTDSEIPICMTSCSPFTTVRPHCYWCPALAGPKDVHGKKIECLRPCQKACTTARARIDISLLLN